MQSVSSGWVISHTHRNVPYLPKQPWFKDIVAISADVVEIPHKGVKISCIDGGKPLPQRSWSSLACLVDVWLEILKMIGKIKAKLGQKLPWKWQQVTK